MAHINRKKLLPRFKTDNAAPTPSSLRPTMKDVAKGARVGLLFAIGFTVLAALIYAAEGPRPFQRNDASFGTVVVLYLVGFTGAGIIAGTFHRLASRYQILAYLIGIIAASPMSFATMAVLNHNVSLWETGDWVPATIGSVIYGILGVRMFRKDPVKWD